MSAEGAGSVDEQVPPTVDAYQRGYQEGQRDKEAAVAQARADTIRELRALLVGSDLAAANLSVKARQWLMYQLGLSEADAILSEAQARLAAEAERA